MAQYHFGKHMRLQVRPPGFLVELVGVGELHAAFLTESRAREPLWNRVQEIRVALRFFPSAIAGAPKSVLSALPSPAAAVKANASLPGTTPKLRSGNLTAMAAQAA